MTLYRQGSIWYYDFTVRGRRHAGSTGETSKTKAQAVHDRLRVQFRDGANIRQVWEQTKSALLGNTSGVKVEPDELWQYFQAHSMSRATSRRMSQYRHHILQFAEWTMQTHGNLNVGDITPSIATEYITHLRNLQGSNYVKNENLLVLKMLFNSFDKNQGVFENPFSKIKPLPNRPISRCIYSPEDLQLIEKNGSGDVLDICLTALYTGLRRGDVCRLQWSAVSPDCKWIHVDQMGKTKQPVDVPVLPRLREHLLSLKRDGKYVYPHLYELINRNNGMQITQMIKKFFYKIGIIDLDQKIDGYKNKVSVKDIHSFRHTFVYLAACNNVPFPVVQSIVGHASPGMTKIYMDHASQADKERYMASMPDLFSGEAKTPARVPIQNIISMVKSDAPKAVILNALQTWA